MTPALFDLNAVFSLNDYLFVYEDELTPERSQAEVDRLVSLLRLTEPVKILDLACGFGRHANRLVQLGHAVVGVDIMPAFLDNARREADELQAHVDYRQGDMRLLILPAEFDYVLLLFTSFGYFSDHENLRVLENAAHALLPGGRLVLDLPQRDTMVQGLPAESIIEKPGGLVINRLSFDPLSGCMLNRRILLRDGLRKDLPFSIRLYNPAEICSLLTQVGLEPEQIYGDGDAPLDSRSRRMLVIARKS
jgi:SAM-dependent methyltransferase